MKRQGADNDIESITGKIHILNCLAFVHGPCASGLFSGCFKHLLRNVNADNRVRPLFRGVNEMPAIAAANVQDGFPFEVRQQAFQRLLFTRAAKPLYGAVHLTVFRWGRGHAFLPN